MITCKTYTGKNCTVRILEFNGMTMLNIILLSSIARVMVHCNSSLVSFGSCKHVLWMDRLLSTDRTPSPRSRISHQARELYNDKFTTVKVPELNF